MALSLSLLASCFCFFKSVVQHVFALQGRHILSADFYRDLSGFRQNLRVNFLELSIQLRNLRV